MRGQVFIAAAAMATALTALAPASAQQYRSYHDAHVANQYECQQSRERRTVGGAVIGGIVGALLGREVADRGVRGEGAALGAVVGATAGGALGRTSARCNGAPPQGSHDPYQGQYSQQYPPQDDEYLEGGPYEGSGYYGDDQYDRNCRSERVTMRDRYGRTYRDTVVMCQDRDGRWRQQ